MNDKKRILFLITELNIGGAEKYYLRLLPYLNNKYNIKFVALQGGKLLDDFSKSGIDTTVLELKNASLLFKSINRFYGIIKEFKPDLLVTVLLHADLFGRIFGRLFGIKTIVSNVQNCYYSRNDLTYKAVKHTSFLVNRYLPNSTSVKNYLVNNWKISEEKILVIPNFTDAVSFSQWKDEDSELAEYFMQLKEKNTRIIASLSSLNPHKRVSDLILAFKKYNDKNPNNNDIVLIFNDGVEKEKLQQLITQNGLNEKVKLMGLVTNTALIYQNADVISLNSEHEGMSSILQESMFFNIEIISTDVPENREVLEGYQGVQFYPVGDIDKLAQLLQYRYNNKIEFSFPHRYTAEYNIEMYNKLLENI